MEAEQTDVICIENIENLEPSKAIDLLERKLQTEQGPEYSTMAAAMVLQGLKAVWRKMTPRPRKPAIFDVNEDVEVGNALYDRPALIDRDALLDSIGDMKHWCAAHPDTGSKDDKPDVQTSPALPTEPALLTPQAAAPQPDPPKTSVYLTPEDLTILELLARESPMTVTQDGFVDVNLSDKTLRDHLDYLRENGLIHRPRGKRKGDAITEAGQELLNGRKTTA